MDLANKAEWEGMEYIVTEIGESEVEDPVARSLIRTIKPLFRQLSDLLEEAYEGS